VAATVGLLAQNPDPGSMAYQEGVRLANHLQWAAALEALERAVLAQPRNARYQKALGVVHGKLGNSVAAAEALGRACLGDPSLPDACYYWGQSLTALSRFDESLRALAMAPPKESPGRLAVAEARALEGLGMMARAEDRYRRAMREADYRVESRLRFGVFLYRCGRAQEALSPLQEAAVLQPDSAEIALELGRVYLQLDRLTAAESSLRRALEIDAQLEAAKLLLDRAIRRQSPGRPVDSPNESSLP
jgi:tetratricopeptide (TPR) repeat protein